jgi:hypothetical protein
MMMTQHSLMQQNKMKLAARCVLPVVGRRQAGDHTKTLIVSWQHAALLASLACCTAIGALQASPVQTHSETLVGVQGYMHTPFVSLCVAA